MMPLVAGRWNVGQGHRNGKGTGHWGRTLVKKDTEWDIEEEKNIRQRRRKGKKRDNEGAEKENNEGEEDMYRKQGKKSGILRGKNKGRRTRKERHA